MEQSSLYDAVEPFRTGRLEVDPRHELYFEESGNPRGKPALFLHGGPGGGTWELDRRYWDPSHYRIVLFDQRGCGKSTPHACLDRNTTWHLVEDIERLRRHLGVERWQVLGGSWGSTLALAYAQTHPSCVSELILRAVFLGRSAETEWFFRRGASLVFPDRWQRFLGVLSEQERTDVLGAYYRRLTSSSAEERIAAAKAWCAWEGAASTLVPSPATESWLSSDEVVLALARIECHYFINRMFLDRDTQLIDRIDRIRHIPTTIVHARYDMICPLESAWQLHQRWPEAAFCIVEGAGHSAIEPAVARELVRATDRHR